MNGKTRATPSTLNAMWATATRLASAVAPTDAVSAVAHVPMFAPSTMATAPSSGSRPWCANARASPSVAADVEEIDRQRRRLERAHVVENELEAEEHEPETQEGLAQVLRHAPARQE